MSPTTDRQRLLLNAQELTEEECRELIEQILLCVYGDGHEEIRWDADLGMNLEQILAGYELTPNDVFPENSTLDDLCRRLAFRDKSGRGQFRLEFADDSFEASPALHDDCTPLKQAIVDKAAERLRRQVLEANGLDPQDNSIKIESMGTLVYDDTKRELLFEGECAVGQWKPWSVQIM